MFIIVGIFAIVALTVVAIKSTKLALYCIFWVFNLRLIHGVALVGAYLAIVNQASIDTWLKNVGSAAVRVYESENVQAEASSLLNMTELEAGTMKLSVPKFLEPLEPEVSKLFSPEEPAAEVIESPPAPEAIEPEPVPEVTKEEAALPITKDTEQ